jgi:hypothetical protein
MAGAADANKVQEVLKELTKEFTKEITMLKQTIAKLESRLSVVEKSQGQPK